MGALHSAYYVFSLAAADMARDMPEIRAAARAALAPALAAAPSLHGAGHGAGLIAPAAGAALLGLGAHAAAGRRRT